MTSCDADVILTEKSVILSAGNFLSITEINPTVTLINANRRKRKQKTTSGNSTVQHNYIASLLTQHSKKIKVATLQSTMSENSYTKLHFLMSTLSKMNLSQKKKFEIFSRGSSLDSNPECKMIMTFLHFLNLLYRLTDLFSLGVRFFNLNLTLLH